MFEYWYFITARSPKQVPCPLAVTVPLRRRAALTWVLTSKSRKSPSMGILPHVYFYAKHIPLFLDDAHYRIPHWSSILSPAPETLHTSHPRLTNQEGIMAFQPSFQSPCTPLGKFYSSFQSVKRHFFSKPIPEGFQARTSFTPRTRPKTGIP